MLFIWLFANFAFLFFRLCVSFKAHFDVKIMQGNTWHSLGIYDSIAGAKEAINTCKIKFDAFQIIKTK